MRKNINIENWQLAWVENATLRQNGLDFKTAGDLTAYGCKIIPATVPGNFEIDFMREGLLPDIYMGADTLETQKYEKIFLEPPILRYLP